MYVGIDLSLEKSTCYGTIFLGGLCLISASISYLVWDSFGFLPRMIMITSVSKNVFVAESCCNFHFFFLNKVIVCKENEINIYWE